MKPLNYVEMHESAHAVIAHHFGIPINYIKLCRVPNGGGAISCKHKRDSVQQLTNSMLVLVAPIAMEGFLDYRLESYRTRKDRHQLNHLLRLCDVPRKDRPALVLRLVRLCEKLLIKNLSKLFFLAELLQDQDLRGAEVHTVLSHIIESDE